MNDVLFPRPRAGDGELREALEAANIPTLLLVLTHLTQDRGWLSGQYQPSRTIALNDNDSGGFSDEKQREIRDAAFAVLRDVRSGELPVPAPPEDDDIVALLGLSLGEPVPEEYAEAMAEDGGFRGPAWLRLPRVTGNAPRVLVIGAGISGICMGIALQRLGLPCTIVERNASIGGTWLENDYPGAGVDTPGHLYSFSFAPRPDWTRYYPKQPEILDYLNSIVRQAGLLPCIRFRTEVVSATWHETENTWHVTTRTSDGTETQHVVDVVISAVGLFNTPIRPNVPGLDTFPGAAFHTARWDHTVDLPGKRVGVIGTGASAMQVVPAIVADAKQVVVFQRSPQWVVPNDNYLRHVDPRVRTLMAEVPGYRTWYRLRLMWMMQDKLHPTLRKDPDWPHPERSVNATNDKHRKFFTDYLDAQVPGDPRLRDALLPSYPPYGKRILLDNNWFGTLRRPNVELVAAGVSAIDGSTVCTEDGGRHDIDVLVFATGFSPRRMLAPMRIHGRSGVSLRDQWGDDDARAYLGLAVPDFPNFFVLYGPNTNPGHGGSEIFHAECQTNYISTMLHHMATSGISSVEVRQDVCDDYNDQVDAEHEAMIWTHPGMTTYYRNAAGRVVTTTPWRLIDYWRMTRIPELKDYHVTYSG